MPPSSQTGSVSCIGGIFTDMSRPPILLLPSYRPMRSLLGPGSLGGGHSTSDSPSSQLASRQAQYVPAIPAPTMATSRISSEFALSIALDLNARLGCLLVLREIGKEAHPK